MSDIWVVYIKRYLAYTAQQYHVWKNIRQCVEGRAVGFVSGEDGAGGASCDEQDNKVD